MATVIAIDRPSRYETVRRAARWLHLRPWTLYAFNWLGPTATLVFRAAPGLQFDPHLVSTVDVDFYFRLLGPDGEPELLDRLAVAGLGHHGLQISARIDRNRISRDEIRSIICARPGMSASQASMLSRFWQLRDTLSRPIVEFA